MSDRRPHWDDDLIDAVRDAVDIEFDGVWRLTEDSILAVIAAVEDWARWEHVPKGTLLRLEQAEAAIARVRDACDLWQRRYDASIRHPTDIPIIPITAVLRALDGAE